MDDASGLGQRHTAAFERYLDMMVNRRKRVDPGDSFIVFRDKQPDITRPDAINKSRAKKLVLAGEAGTGSIDLSDRDILVAGGRDGEDGDDASGDGPANHRYVQLCFMRRTFFMDLPTEALSPIEAEQLIARRSGFFHLRERRPMFYSFGTWQKLIKDWNPVWKEYINSDTRSAAEDIAFIWFQLWKYPLDWQFWYSAHTFKDKRKHDWEGDYPVRLTDAGCPMIGEDGGV